MIGDRHPVTRRIVLVSFAKALGFTALVVGFYSLLLWIFG